MNLHLKVTPLGGVELSKEIRVHVVLSHRNGNVLDEYRTELRDARRGEEIAFDPVPINLYGHPQEDLLLHFVAFEVDDHEADPINLAELIAEVMDTRIGERAIKALLAAAGVQYAALEPILSRILKRLFALIAKRTRKDDVLLVGDLAVRDRTGTLGERKGWRARAVLDASLVMTPAEQYAWECSCFPDVVEEINPAMMYSDELYHGSDGETRLADDVRTAPEGAAFKLTGRSHNFAVQEAKRLGRCDLDIRGKGFPEFGSPMR